MWSFGLIPREGAANLQPPEAPVTGQLFPSVDVNVKHLHVPFVDVLEAEEETSLSAFPRGQIAVVGTGNTGWTMSKVDIPAHTRTAHNGLLQKSLEEDLC